MTNIELADKLDLYNHWRRGDCPFEEPGCEPPMTPKELGLLIEEVIKILRDGQTCNPKDHKRRKVPCDC